MHENVNEALVANKLLDNRKLPHVDCRDIVSYRRMLINPQIWHRAALFVTGSYSHVKCPDYLKFHPNAYTKSDRLQRIYGYWLDG